MKRFAQTLEIVRKELTHVLRDRRTVLSTQVYAVVGPVLLVATLSALSGDSERSSRIGSVGDLAPLRPALVEAGLELVTLPSAPLEVEGLAGVDAVLRAPVDLSARFEEHEAATIDLLLGDGPDAGRAERRVRAAVGRLAQRLSATELLRRGIVPSVAQPVKLQTVRLGGGGRPHLFATLTMMYIVLAPLLASTGAAIDTATGERERGTLALMRLQPLSSWSWVTGKWLVVALFAVGGTIVTAAASVVAVQLLAPAVASSLALDPAHLLVLCGATLPIGLVVSAVAFALALQSRSTMEAQNRITLLTLAPVAIGLLASAGRAPGGSAFPMLHEVTSLAGWLTGEAFPLQQAAVNALLSLGVVTATLLWAGRRIRSERYGGA